MALINKTRLVAVLGAGAAAAVVAFTGGREGVVTAPYQDKLAHNVWTVCYGDTQVEMRRYTSAECKALLADRLADYAGPVRDMTPGFDTLTDGQKVAAVDFAYNLGVGAYRAADLRKMYSAKQFPEACEQFLRYKFAGGKDCSIAANRCGGIIKRRQAERTMCRGE